MRYNCSYFLSNNEDINKIIENYYFLNKFNKTKFPIYNEIIEVCAYQYVRISWWDEWDRNDYDECYLTDCGKIHELFKKNNNESFLNSNIFRSLLQFHDIHKCNYKFKDELTIITNKNLFGHNRQFKVYKRFLKDLSILLKNDESYKIYAPKIK